MTDDTNAIGPLDPDSRGEDDIASHLLEPLRAPEQLDATFSARVMSAVHAEVRGRRHSSRAGWWRRRRTLHLSPLAGLAMAAGVAGLVVLGVAAGDRLPGRPEVFAALAPPAATKDTVHVVRFVFTDREAKAVSLVGDFNAWSKDATPLMEATSDGTWVVTVELERGRHEYAFVVRRGDEERWSADPFASPVRDDFGTESSVVTVGGPPALDRASTS